MLKYQTGSPPCSTGWATPIPHSIPSFMPHWTGTSVDHSERSYHSAVPHWTRWWEKNSIWSSMARTRTTSVTKHPSLSSFSKMAIFPSLCYKMHGGRETGRMKKRMPSWVTQRQISTTFPTLIYPPPKKIAGTWNSDDLSLCIPQHIWSSSAFSCSFVYPHILLSHIPHPSQDDIAFFFISQQPNALVTHTVCQRSVTAGQAAVLHMRR